MDMRLSAREFARRALISLSSDNRRLDDAVHASSRTRRSDSRAAMQRILDPKRALAARGNRSRYPMRLACMKNSGA